MGTFFGCVQDGKREGIFTYPFGYGIIFVTIERLTPRTGAEESLGLILIDVDYFKRINDAFGHQVGDSVLKQVAGCIRSVIRANDIAGRFGGDEFIVLLPGADARTTAAVAGRLEKKVRDDEVLAGRGVTLSIGGTSHVITSEDYDSELMLKQADDALYRAKEAGRNLIVMYGEKE